MRTARELGWAATARIVAAIWSRSDAPERALQKLPASTKRVRKDHEACQLLPDNSGRLTLQGRLTPLVVI